MRWSGLTLWGVIGSVCVGMWMGCGDGGTGGDDDAYSPPPETSTPTGVSPTPEEGSPSPGSPTPGGSPTPDSPTPGASSPTPAVSPTPVVSPTPATSPTPAASPTPTTSPTPETTLDQDQDGFPATSEGGNPADCDDHDANRYPGAPETAYDGIDQDCDGSDLIDVDGDGRTALQAGGNDCDDADAEVYPGALEVPYDGVDDDCSGADLIDVDGDTYVAAQAGGNDCDDQDVNTHPGATEFADGRDNNCDGKVDNDLNTYDDDGDGFSEASGDCDDTARTIYPGAPEVAYDGVDQDCSGGDLTDVDGDGYASTKVEGGNDCDDSSTSVHPDASETCNGIDDNCNSSIDDGVLTTYYQDLDQDGYGNTSKSQQACAAPTGYVATAGDCKDTNDAINPGVTEICNNIDDDCSGVIDDGLRQTFYQDLDKDGYGNPAVSLQSCTAPSGYVSNNTDCNDGAASIHPNAGEVCNSLDDNCDGQIDEGVQVTYYQDLDGDGYGNAAKSQQACSAPAGYVTSSTDCKDSNDAIHPGATEICNSADDNCDGQIDEGVKATFYADTDKDGYGDPASSTLACAAPAGYASNGLDCNDHDAAVHPLATETCDGIDNDCNAKIDEGLKGTWYQDSDSDGYGTSSSSTQACTQPSGYVADSTDCNDSSASVHPGAAEACNSIDDNCNGQTDEGVKTTYYKDVDGDGYGDSNITTQGCTQPAGYSAKGGDCNDTNPAIHVNAPEVANGYDDNCDGQADEGVYFTNCNTIKKALPASVDGLYTIDPDGSSTAVTPFQTYCDMTTDGGGWTLVAYAGDNSLGFPRMDIDVGTFDPNNRTGKAAKAAVAVVKLSTEMSLAYHTTPNFSGSMAATTDTVAVTIPDPSIVDFKTTQNNGSCVAVSARRLKPAGSTAPCIGSTSGSKTAVSASNCNPTSAESTAGVWTKSMGGTYAYFAYGLFQTQSTCNSWPDISHHWWVDNAYYNWEPSATKAWSGTVNGATSIWLR